MKPGSTLIVPELPGSWSVWSKSDECPGAHFVVPCSPESRETGIKYATIKVTRPRGAARDVVTLLGAEKST